MPAFVKRIGATLLGLMALVDSTAGMISQPLHDSVNIAQRVVRAAYPELQGTVAVAMESDTDSDWRSASLVGVTVRQFDRLSSNQTRVALTAHLQVTRGRPSFVQFSGDYVEHDDFRSVVAYARKQNDTRERVIEELKKAGLRFMADEKAFLDAARLNRLEPALGKVEKITARFVAVPPIPTPVDYEHQPVWIVELQTTPKQDVTECYDVFVEPVNLRILRISNELCSK